MSADTPVAGGEEKPDVKTGGNKSPFQHHGARNNNHRRDNYPKKEKFLGADPKLSGKVFEAKQNQSEQVTNFNLVNEIIKAQVGTECDPFVLESLEKEVVTLPSEPTANTTKDKDGNDTISEVDKMKFKSKYNKCLIKVDKVEMQRK